REGYEILINQGIEKARTFAGMIDEQPDFELITRPELNILTYRYCPEPVQQALAIADELQAEKMNTCLNRITKFIQKTQRERGKAFVSRTRLEPARYYHFPCIVFRVVLANPLTTPEILADILKEQRELSREDGIADEIAILHQMAEAVLSPRPSKAKPRLKSAQGSCGSFIKMRSSWCNDGMHYARGGVCEELFKNLRSQSAPRKGMGSFSQNTL